jgi:hypothetical protein
MFENKVLKTFGPKRKDVTEERENYKMRNFIICISQERNIVKGSKSRGREMWKHAQGT